MLSGQGRYGLTGRGFGKKANMGAGENTSMAVFRGRNVETAAGGQTVPNDTTVRSFAKPTNVGLQIGLVPSDPHMVISLAREMYDNDSVLGASIDTMATIPFGDFSLSGLPNKDMAKPYETSLDRIRSKTLMPVLATSQMVDGAFLGGGLFDDGGKVWNAVIPYDILHSTITPAPFFGATPIVDVQIQQDTLKSIRSVDPRMQRYYKFLPQDMLRGGTLELPLENTFYIPNRTTAHVPLGISVFRKIMVVYILEKGLARGTVEMVYRRQRPMLHIQAGDENWDASIAEMQQISDLFMAADLDPLSATIVTRPGVNPQEVGGMNDMFKWTDVIDQLTTVKLNGIGVPVGLLGGDLSLDSVSAALTVFTNKNRQFRNYITRLFFYEKFFPYISITNDHKKDLYQSFESKGILNPFEDKRFQSRANDSEVDMENYYTPTISWHNSLRPEGDKDYLELLTELRQNGVPVPIRMMASVGGLDIGDILNGAPDDIAIRTKVAKYMADINGMDQAAMPQDQQGGDDQGQGGGGFEGSAIDNAVREHLIQLFTPVKRKGILGRTYDDRLMTRAKSNNKQHYTTAREYKRIADEENKLISQAAGRVARMLNKTGRVETVALEKRR